LAVKFGGKILWRMLRATPPRDGLAYV